MKKLLTNKYVYTVLYIILVRYIWINFCVHWYGYMGFTYNGANNIECLLAYIIATVPVFFFRGIKNVSSFLSAVLYIMAYIPIIIGLELADNIPADVSSTYQMILMMAMSLFFYADRIKLPPLKNIRTGIKPEYILVLTGILILFLLVAFRNNLHFAGLEELYDVREQNDTVIHAGINGYILLWTQKALLPFLFVIYYFKNDKRSKILSYIILAMYVPIFMMSAQKATILTPLLMLGMAALLNHLNKFYAYFVLVLSLLSLVVLSASDSIVGFSIGSILFMRTICVCPLLLNMYTVFFQNNPYTYFSHISFVNKLTNMYPYDAELGQIVGDDAGNNANAFFWTTDGVASCGATGLVIISIIFFIYLIFINRLSQKKIPFNQMLLIIVPSLTALLNSPFFTYLFSHGILIIILLLLIVDIPKRTQYERKDV